MVTAYAVGRFAFAFSALIPPSFTVARLAANALLVTVKLRAVALRTLSAWGELAIRS